MTDDILPFIEEEDWNEFQRTIEGKPTEVRKEWPDTYEVWLEVHRHAKQALQCKGLDPKEIPISPHEFAQWCAHHSQRGTSQDLLRCAVELYATVNGAEACHEQSP